MEEGLDFSPRIGSTMRVRLLQPLSFTVRIPEKELLRICKIENVDHFEVQLWTSVVVRTHVVNSAVEKPSEDGWHGISLNLHLWDSKAAVGARTWTASAWLLPIFPSVLAADPVPELANRFEYTFRMRAASAGQSLEDASWVWLGTFGNDGVVELDTTLTPFQRSRATLRGQTEFSEALTVAVGSAGPREFSPALVATAFASTLNDTAEVDWDRNVVAGVPLKQFKLLKALCRGVDRNVIGRALSHAFGFTASELNRLHKQWGTEPESVSKLALRHRRWKLDVTEPLMTKLFLPKTKLPKLFVATWRSLNHSLPGALVWQLVRVTELGSISRKFLFAAVHTLSLSGSLSPVRESLKSAISSLLRRAANASARAKRMSRHSISSGSESASSSSSDNTVSPYTSSVPLLHKWAVAAITDAVVSFVNDSVNVASMPTVDARDIGQQPGASSPTQPRRSASPMPLRRPPSPVDSARAPLATVRSAMIEHWNVGALQGEELVERTITPVLELLIALSAGNPKGMSNKAFRSESKEHMEVSIADEEIGGGVSGVIPRRLVLPAHSIKYACSGSCALQQCSLNVGDSCGGGGESTGGACSRAASLAGTGVGAATPKNVALVGLCPKIVGAASSKAVSSSLPSSFLWLDSTRAVALAAAKLALVDETAEFHATLSACAHLARICPMLRDAVLRKVLDSWPRGSSRNEIALLNMLANILFESETQHLAVTDIMTKILNRVLSCVKSDHESVVKAALSFLNPERSLLLRHKNDPATISKVLRTLHSVATKHWSSRVRENVSLMESAYNTLLDQSTSPGLVDSFFNRSKDGQDDEIAAIPRHRLSATPPSPDLPGTPKLPSFSGFPATYHSIWGGDDTDSIGDVEEESELVKPNPRVTPISEMF